MNTTTQVKPMPARAKDVYDFWFFPGCMEQLGVVLGR